MRNSFSYAVDEPEFEPGIFGFNNISGRQDLAFSSKEDVGSNVSMTESVVIPKQFTRETRTRETELEWWLGTVTGIGTDSFTTILTDLSDRENVVEFELDMLDENGKELLSVGSIFTYSVSSLHNPSRLHGGASYVTKLSFSGKRRWYSSYEKKAKELVDEFFSDELLEAI